MWRIILMARARSLWYSLLVSVCEGSHHDALARMDAQRVEVLHVADGDAVVVAVAHHLVLYLLPASQRLLHQHLRREREGLLGLRQQFVVVVAEAGTETAEGVGGTQYDGESQFVGCPLHLLDSRARLALDGLHANLVEALHEEVAVFGVDDGLHGCAQHLHAVFLQDSTFIEFHAAVQGCLSAKREQDAVGAFLLDDALHELGRHGLEIHRVGHILAGLHRGDIRVDEHRVDALFLQRLQGLRSAVVELARLTNFQGSAA